MSATRNSAWPAAVAFIKWDLSFESWTPLHSHIVQDIPRSKTYINPNKNTSNEFLSYIALLQCNVTCSASHTQLSQIQQHANPSWANSCFKWRCPVKLRTWCPLIFKVATGYCKEPWVGFVIRRVCYNGHCKIVFLNFQIRSFIIGFPLYVFQCNNMRYFQFLLIQ